MSPRYAVIDIGTLKVKSLIAEITSKGIFKPVYKSNTLTCFGCDMNRNGGNISVKNLQDTVTELLRLKNLLKENKVFKIKIVSTHAMRRAKNQKQVLQSIKQQTGFEVENITQDDEARLFFLAVMRGFPKSSQKYAVVDMGGGSVQILIGQPDKLQATHLLPIGAQTLHAKFTQDSENKLSFTTEQDLERMRRHILNQLLPVEQNLQTPLIYGSTNIIDLMQAIKLPLEENPDSPSHPYKIYAQHLQDFIHKILPLNYKTREAKYPFQYGYMWGVDKAFLNILTITEHLNSPHIIPSNSNIAEGLIYDLLD